MAECIDHVNSYQCLCAAGYVGIHCETDVDECSSSPCQHDALCDDLVDGFTCTCVAGFTDDICSTNIDDCASGELTYTL